MDEFFDIEHLGTAMAVRAAMNVRSAMKKLMDKSVPKMKLINEKAAGHLLQTSKCHHEYVCFSLFKKAIDNYKFKNENSRAMMTLMAKIFALNILKNDTTTLYESGYFARGSGELLVECFDKACQMLRPQIIPLIEGENEEIFDNSYMSAIGNKYGDIYERLMELSMGNKVNNTPKAAYWDSLIKPIMYRKYNMKQKG